MTKARVSRGVPIWLLVVSVLAAAAVGAAISPTVFHVWNGSSPTVRNSKETVDGVSAQVAIYLDAARSMMHLGNKMAALDLLVRAESVAGSEERAAIALLASELLPSPRSPDAPRVTPSTQEVGALTPEELVRSYLAAHDWRERLPYVLNPRDVAPLMAMHYRNQSLEGIAALFADAESGPSITREKKDRNEVVVAVDTSLVHPEFPVWRFVVKPSDHGYRIDWQKTVARNESEAKEIRRRFLGLENAEVEIVADKISDPYGDGDCIKVALRVYNRSKCVLDSCSMNFSLLDAEGEIIDSEKLYVSHVLPDKPVARTLLFNPIDAKLVRSWEATIERAEVKGDDILSEPVTEYFSLRKAGALIDE